MRVFSKPEMSAAAGPPDPPYYGVDHHAPDLGLQIERAIESHVRSAETGVHHIHALIDGATDESFGNELMASSREPRSVVRAIYEGTPLGAAGSCGPFLWNVHRADLPALLARCSGRPMLGFIQTPLDLEQTCLHFASFTRGQTPDGLKLALRIADPIRLHDLLVAFGTHLQSRLRSGFAAWHLIGRDGNLITWTGTATLDQKPHLRTLPWPLTDDAFARLMESSEADEMLCSVVERCRSLYTPGASVELHQRVRELLDVIETLRVENLDQKRKLMRTALALPDTPAAVHWLGEQMAKEFQ